MKKDKAGGSMMATGIEYSTPSVVVENALFVSVILKRIML
jgi:hypothetical protein